MPIAAPRQTWPLPARERRKAGFEPVFELRDGELRAPSARLRLSGSIGSTSQAMLISEVISSSRDSRRTGAARHSFPRQ